MDSGSPGGASSNSLRVVQHVPGISKPTRMWKTPQSPDLISDDEYRSLEFFHQNTTQAFTADIGVLLLRVAYHQPILRSIAVALGSLHRSFVLHGRGPLANSTDAQFMLLHYNRAIRELVSIQPETAQRDETFLIACILFFCFECLRGEYKNAVRHATSGLKILKQQQALPKGDSILPLEAITLPFCILETQVLELKGEEALDVELHPAMLSSFTHPSISPLSPSSDANEMIKAFQLFCNRFTRFEAACGVLSQNRHNRAFEFQRQVQQIEEGYLRIRGDVENWLHIFEVWLDSCQIREDPTVMIMKVWRLLMRVFLELHWPPPEHSWDKYVPVFAAINSLAADILQEPPRPLQHSNTRPTMFTFSLSLGIVTPLFICATRCRLSSIRHRAINLLLHSRRREGLWDAELAGHIAERIVSLEESAAGMRPGSEYSPGDIDVSARIGSLSPYFTERKQAEIGYSRMQVSCGDPTE